VILFRRSSPQLIRAVEHSSRSILGKCTQRDGETREPWGYDGRDVEGVRGIERPCRHAQEEGRASVDAQTRSTPF